MSLAKRWLVCLALGTVAWMHVAWRYWRDAVPLVPSRIVSIAGRDPASTVPTVTGEIPLRRRSTPLSTPRVMFTGPGPLQFLDPATGEITREYLTDRDEILALEHGTSRRVATLRGLDIHVIDLPTETTLCNVPVTAKDVAATFVDHGSLLVILDSATLRAVDVLTGREHWSLTVNEPVLWMSDYGTNLLLVAPSLLLNNKTGQVVQKLHRDSWTYCLTGSPDGTRLLTEHSTHVRVLDGMDGKELFRLPHAKGYTFSPDSRRIWLSATGDDGSTAFAEWDALQGHQLAGTPPGMSQGELAMHSADARYSVRKISRVVGVELPGWVKTSSLATTLLSALPARRRTSGYAVFDESTRSLTGHLSPTGRIIPHSNGTGFSILHNDELHDFNFPPRRNWSWFWTRVVALPLAMAIAACSGPLAVRRQRRVPVPPDSARV